jgi:hypothetical protein
MNAIAKLRQEYKKEKMLMKKAVTDAGDDMLRKKNITKTYTITSATTTTTKFKLEVDPVKLDHAIKKACIPVEKRNIVFLDTLPKKVAVPAPVAAPIAICQAKNLNGTPCKCKAKAGKFCAKHT